MNLRKAVPFCIILKIGKDKFKMYWMASSKACKSRPVHATNKNMKSIEVLLLLPYFDRYEDQFVVANFDGEPMAAAKMFSKMPKTVGEDIESKL
ncbi:protein PAF1 homolog [Silene latifolia]|uniref:protein PAF1 homolog n=1 Tax=Silene latifolia TaxID=37657 RepID=UPI003D787A1B